MGTSLEVGLDPLGSHHDARLALLRGVGFSDGDGVEEVENHSGGAGRAWHRLVSVSSTDESAELEELLSESRKVRKVMEENKLWGRGRLVIRVII